MISSVLQNSVHNNSYLCQFILLCIGMYCLVTLEATQRDASSGASIFLCIGAFGSSTLDWTRNWQVFSVNQNKGKKTNFITSINGYATWTAIVEIFLPFLMLSVYPSFLPALPIPTDSPTPTEQDVPTKPTGIDQLPKQIKVCSA